MTLPASLLVVTGVADTYNHADDAYASSLREAIDTANITAGAQQVWLPGWHFLMTLSGVGAITQGDFDVPAGSQMTIRGVGAGSTVIDAASLAMRDRIFEVRDPVASLNLWRLTLTGGSVAAGALGGGAIYADTGSTLELNEVPAVGNTSNSIGGAIRIGTPNTLIVRNSVFTDNAATESGGAIAISPSGAASRSDRPSSLTI